MTAGGPEDPARALKARTRVAVSAALGAVAGAALAVIAPWQVAVLAGWSVAAFVFVGWAILRFGSFDGAATAAHATREDDSRAMADIVVLTAAAASLGAIGLALVKASTAHGAGKAAIVTVAVLAVAGAWAVVHTVFTLRYARVFFTDGGGIEFNDDEAPDYHDFAYFALTVGMTFQVSDTNVTTKSTRRVVTRHAVISYAFGAIVVAMAINVVAGLLNR